jgi:hypothetical protein
MCSLVNVRKRRPREARKSKERDSALALLSIATALLDQFVENDVAINGRRVAEVCGDRTRCVWLDVANAYDPGVASSRIQVERLGQSRRRDAEHRQGGDESQLGFVDYCTHLPKSGATRRVCRRPRLPRGVFDSRQILNRHFRLNGYTVQSLPSAFNKLEQVCIDPVFEGSAHPMRRTFVDLQGGILDDFG